MSIHAAIFHRTRYDYDRPVQLFPQIVRLRPAPHTRTDILSYSIKVLPEAHYINWQQDAYGNFLARLVFPERSDHFEVTVDVVADMAAIDPFDFFLEDDAQHAPFSYDATHQEELKPYLQRVGGKKAFRKLSDWAHVLFQKTAGYAEEDQLRTIDFLVAVNQRLTEMIAYTVRMEPGVQTPDETLKLGSGSCRDSAWLLVALMREVGLAARFVSGYLIQLKADEVALDGPSGPAEDFTDLHAWTEIYVPGAGWIGLDPTSGLFAGEGHIPLAATPSPSSAAPISGGVEKAEAELQFDMKVSRVHETPRVTKPLSDQQWTAIDKAGAAIDARLQAGDVRLTMGGEPTFVASSDRDAPEWNIDAVGPTKRLYADKLIRRLQKRFAPHGFLHHGQGKWYPGEQLPRWAFSLYWRKDGVPLWGNPDHAATEDGPRTATPAAAQAFAEGLAQALGLAAENAMAAYEDPAEFMLAEQNLAPNVDPIDNKLDDAEARTRLAKVFDRGLETPSAYVLPIQLAQAPATASKDLKELAKVGAKRRFQWRSDKWRTRRERLFLKPGDSPAGFRLPLNAITYEPEDERQQVIVQDPFAPRDPLPAALAPAPAQWQDRSATPVSSDTPSAPQMASVPPGGPFTGGPVVRTAMSIEARDGIMHVFMPPVQSADAYLDLVSAVEETAAHLGLTTYIEGYPPPDDHRINLIKVTPDPGVIEVNIQPAANWAEQVEISQTIYEEAAACGLEASKFLNDGRPTGSGGGAHVVVGGATPADSPFLRRPDVLASLIRFWQNHPSLSYLFSGMFVGPTSQAPRLDEARQSSLYEMDLALRQIPFPFDTGATPTPPWLVDRIFRNLLVDITGNTHRAEICIDKLYSPDSVTGRLGLVEFRAFEMPPHVEMNLAQQLILRGLIAWFWDHPYTRPLIRHGNGLHDRFMLPHYLWADFKDVLSELSGGLGVAFDPAWYTAQFEFRFPHYGTMTHKSMAVEIRSGLEPWPVLGEEGTSAGTARFVDSSVERLQVQVTGGQDQRYALGCNGIRVPLQETDRADLKVAGIRFRAWHPPSCLHPTIYPHTPLTFDIVDLWTGRAVKGCTYYADHPGGRNSELQPVNALEAEGRRRARFEPFGHTPGPLTLADPRYCPEFPVTLDLMAQ